MAISQLHLPVAAFSRGIALAGILTALVVAPAAYAVGPVIALERVSIGPDGMQLPHDSLRAAISADARYVAFDNGPASGYANTVYLRDRTARTTQLISVGIGGAVQNGISSNPAISGDGRYVGFQSSASNLVVGDTNATSDVFLRDHILGTTVRVSVAGDGPDTAGGGRVNQDDNVASWISGDGRYVVFISSAKLTANVTGGVQDHVFRRDVVANTTALVDVNPAGGAADAICNGGSISADGRFVLFNSQASDIIAGSNPYHNPHLYVRDMQLGITTSLTPNLSSPGICPDQAGESQAYNLSSNGRFAAFDSLCTDLAAGQQPLDHLFVRDLALGVTHLFRLNDDGSAGGDGQNSSVSNSGRYAIAWTQAKNVVPGDTDAFGDVFLHDFTTLHTWRISQRADTGEPANDNSGSPLIGAGGHVVFTSYATNLVDGDTNNASDIFVATLDEIFASGFE
jgi:hypothetical protein